MASLALQMPQPEPLNGEYMPMEAPLELTEEAKRALVDLVMSALKEESTVRRMEVVEARRQRYYKRGDQYIYYDRTAGQFRPAIDSGKELPRYTEVYNIYAPHHRSFVSVLSQSEPGINFVPIDLQQAADITAANRAEKLRGRLNREVKAKDIQTDIASGFCTDGRVVVWTRIEEGKVKSTVHGVLDVKVPIFTNSMEECDYCCISRERSISKLKRLYPEIKSKISSATDNGENAYERYARLGVLSGTRGRDGQDSLKNLTTEHTCWLRPERFEKAPDAQQELLEQLYPEGVRVTVVSGEFADAIPEAMDGVLAVAHASPGDGQNRPSLLKDLMPLQDAFNDGMNQVREYFDFGIPALWINQSAVDAEGMADQRSEPGVMHTAEWAPTNPLRNAFFQEAPAVLPDGLMNYLSMVSNDLAQFITGDYPALQGEGDPHSETFAGQKLLTDQAKGGLSTPWQSLQQIEATRTKQGIDCLALLLQGQQISIENGDGTSDQFSADEVMPGLYGCYPDADSSFPETMADKRAAFQALVTQIGQMEGGDALIANPDNMKRIVQFGGVEFTVPQAVAHDQQLREIEQLLREQPLPPDPMAIQQAAAQAQQPQKPNNPAPPPQMPPPQSSVPIDVVYDYHQWHFDKIQAWMASESRLEEDRKGNQGGIENVRLHGLLHKAQIDQQEAAKQSVAPKPISWTANLEDVAAPVQAALLQRESLPGDPQAQQEHQGEQDAKTMLHKVIK